MNPRTPWAPLRLDSRVIGVDLWSPPYRGAPMHRDRPLLVRGCLCAPSLPAAWRRRQRAGRGRLPTPRCAPSRNPHGPLRGIKDRPRFTVSGDGSRFKSPRFWTCSSRWVRLHSVQGLFLRVWVFGGAPSPAPGLESGESQDPPSSGSRGWNLQRFWLPQSPVVFVSLFRADCFPFNTWLLAPIQRFLPNTAKVGENWVCERTPPP